MTHVFHNQLAVSLTFFFAGPVNLVLDLLIVHECVGTSFNPVINGNLHNSLPPDIDKSLHDVTDQKIRECHADYNNRPLILFLTGKNNIVVHGSYNPWDFWNKETNAKKESYCCTEP
jgi:hypothetical protein